MVLVRAAILIGDCEVSGWEAMASVVFRSFRRALSCLAAVLRALPSLATRGAVASVSAAFRASGSMLATRGAAAPLLIGESGGALGSSGSMPSFTLASATDIAPLSTLRSTLRRLAAIFWAFTFAAFLALTLARLAALAAFLAPGALPGWGTPWGTGTGLEPMCRDASMGQTSGKRREMWSCIAAMECCMDAIPLDDMNPRAGSLVGTPVRDGGCMGPGVCWLPGDSAAWPASR